MDYLTVEEFAHRIKMHPQSVRKSIKEGKIYASRPSMGKRGPFRIAESELERLHVQSMCEKKS
jgi:excisionase family DNA binding protein